MQRWKIVILSIQSFAGGAHCIDQQFSQNETLQHSFKHIIHSEKLTDVSLHHSPCNMVELSTTAMTKINCGGGGHSHKPQKTNLLLEVKRWRLSRPLERTHTNDTLYDEKDFPPEDYRRFEEVRKQHTLEWDVSKSSLDCLRESVKKTL